MKTYRVGLLVDSIDDNFSNGICLGASKAAKELGIQLNIFFGGYIEADLSTYNYQKNNVFALAKTNQLDFLIVSISSMARTGYETKLKILDYFKDIPVVTLNDLFDHYSGVTFDNKNGLVEGIEYIINTVGRKHFVIVGSNQASKDSRQRIDTICDTLTKHHILVSNHQIYHAKDFSRDNEETIEKALDENPDVDALICGNDELAIAAYHVLEQRGIVIGKDISVTGYDDIRESSRLTPPLASVSAPSSLLGYCAMKIGEEMMRTGKTRHYMIPTHFLPRDSLDLGVNIRKIFVREIQKILKRDFQFDELWNLIDFYLFNSSESVLSKNDKMVYKDLVQYIIDYDYRQPLDMPRQQKLNHDLSVFIRRLNYVYFDVYKALEILDILSEQMIHYHSFETLQQALSYKEIYQRFFVMLANTFNKVISYRSRDGYEENHLSNMVARKMLVFNNRKECYYNILAAIVQIGISNGALFLYTHPKEYTFFSQVDLKEKVHMVGSVKDGEIHTNTRNETILLEDILSKTQPHDTKHPYALVSIYTNNQLFGYLVCDVSLKSYSLLEFLSIHIGSTINTLALVDAFAQKSKTDLLTGLLNRRGMREQCQELDGQKDVYVLFGDLDYLKTINDTYGHKEGDVSLKKAATIIQEALPDDAIISRIGGDEYVGVFQLQEPFVIEYITERIQMKQDEINERIKRKIETHISIGIKHIHLFEIKTIEDIIKEADRIMYQHKISKRINHQS